MKNNENIDKNKIIPMDSYKKQLEEKYKAEADELEREVEAKPELKDIKSNSDTLQKIIDELRRRGEWHGGDAEEYSTELGAKKAEKLDAEEARETEAIEKIEEIKEIREAEQTDKIPETEKKKRKWKWQKFAGIAAAVVLCVFVAEMTNQANREAVLGLINSTSKNRVIVFEKDSTKALDTQEEKELDEVRKVNITPVTFGYKPQDMKYKRSHIEQNIGLAYMYYGCGNRNLSVKMIRATNTFTTGIQTDGETENTGTVYVEWLNRELDVTKLINEDGGVTYQTEFKEGDIYYNILGDIEEDEFKKIIKEIILE